MFHGMGENMTAIIEMTYEFSVGNIVNVGDEKVLFQPSFVRCATLISARKGAPTCRCQMARLCSERPAST